MEEIGEPTSVKEGAPTLKSQNDRRRPTVVGHPAPFGRLRRRSVRDGRLVAGDWGQVARGLRGSVVSEGGRNASQVCIRQWVCPVVWRSGDGIECV